MSILKLWTIWFNPTAHDIFDFQINENTINLFLSVPQLQVVGALCESNETQERVLLEVTPESFEDTLHSVLQYTLQVSL